MCDTVVGSLGVHKALQNAIIGLVSLIEEFYYNTRFLKRSLLKFSLSKYSKNIWFSSVLLASCVPLPYGGFPITEFCAGGSFL
jgi:hypothetical protein